MRVIILAGLIASSLGLQASPCAAQAPASDKTEAPKALAEPAPPAAATEPARGADAAKPPIGRVGSLSPDEERRAARARARARAAAGQPAPATKDGAVAKATPERPAIHEAARPVAPAPQPAIAPPAQQAAAAHPLAAETPKKQTARSAARRFAARSDGRRTRHAFADRFPRIGDRVPSGVPLYPMPGYAPQPRIAEMVPVYNRPPYPVYPVRSYYPAYPY